MKNYLRDCGGGCGAFTNSTTCGNCIKVGDTRNYTDCNGDCFESARINKCGQCAGGKTGKAKNAGTFFDTGQVKVLIQNSRKFHPMYCVMLL